MDFITDTILRKIFLINRLELGSCLRLETKRDMMTKSTWDPE